MIDRSHKTILKPMPFNPARPDAPNLVQASDRPRTQPPTAAARMAADSLTLSSAARVASPALYTRQTGGVVCPPAAASVQIARDGTMVNRKTLALHRSTDTVGPDKAPDTSPGRARALTGHAHTDCANKLYAQLFGLK